MTNAPVSASNLYPANVRLSEAIERLVPAIGSIDADTRQQTLRVLRQEFGDVAEVTSYERLRLLTREQALAVLSDLRGRLIAYTRYAGLLDRETEVRSQERLAVDALHEAFLRGSVIVYGRKRGRKDDWEPPQEIIPSTFFSRQRALAWRLNEIRQKESVVAQTRAVLGDEYTDVLVDGVSFERWRASQNPTMGLSGSASGPDGRSALQQMAWQAAYSKYIDMHQTATTPPNRKADAAYMKSHFPDIPVHTVYDIRRRMAPASWTARGRPRKGAPVPRK